MKLLLAVDLRQTAPAIVDAGAAWATALGATLDIAYVDAAEHAVHLISDDHIRTLVRAAWARARERDLEDLRTLMNRIPETCRGAIRYAQGRPGYVLPEMGSDYDALLIGTHGRQGLAHFIMGSVAERVVRTAPCSVLVLRLPDSEEE